MTPILQNDDAISENYKVILGNGSVILVSANAILEAIEFSQLHHENEETRVVLHTPLVITLK